MKQIDPMARQLAWQPCVLPPGVRPGRVHVRLDGRQPVNRSERLIAEENGHDVIPRRERAHELGGVAIESPAIGARQETGIDADAKRTGAQGRRMVPPAGAARQRALLSGRVGYAPLEFDALVLPLVRGRTVLDLGCGFGHWGHLLRTHYYSEDPSRAAVITGVDAHAPNIAFCERTNIYDRLEVADAVTYLSRQPDRTFDTILAVELLEHLPRPDGERLLGESRRVASQAVIITTPNGPAYRPGHVTMTGFNPHEHHVSAWTAAELRGFGFTVRGVGHRARDWPIRGINRALNTLPTLDHVLAAVAVHRPALARHLLAFRHV